MAKYELVVILDSKTTPVKKKAFEEKISKIVTVFEGKVLSTLDWGIKEFVYPIKKKDSGLFLIFTLELDPKAAKQLPSKFKLEEDILRHLLIKLEK